MRKYPLVYEVNFATWLVELSTKYKTNITLQNIPEVEIKKFKDLGCDYLWLMGIWQRSNQSRKIAQSIYTEYPAEKIGGSPYAIYDYQIDPRFGMETDLLKFRRNLYKFNLKLILDFVPNHFAVDSIHLKLTPEYFLKKKNCLVPYKAEDFFQNNFDMEYYAHGKDPNFSGWTDTVQLDFRKSETQEFMIEQLLQISRLADGVRCDMAMLVLENIFNTTWGREFSDITNNFWRDAILAVKKNNPNFILVAEAYWNKEWELIESGFDYVYDKKMYDMVIGQNVSALQGHLGFAKIYYDHLLHFTENHDEPRLAALFPNSKIKSFFRQLLFAPGMRLIYQHQLGFCNKKLPIQVIDIENAEDCCNNDFKKELMILNTDLLHEGSWSLYKKSNCLGHYWQLGSKEVIIFFDFENCNMQKRIMEELCEQGFSVFTENIFIKGFRL